MMIDEDEDEDEGGFRWLYIYIYLSKVCIYIHSLPFCAHPFPTLFFLGPPLPELF